MKKIISLLMALIFVFSMATPSFAAVAANEAAVQSSVVNDDEGIAGANNLLGKVVDIVNVIWTKIVDFFKSIFGFGFRPGTYNVIYYTDSTKQVVYKTVPTLEGDPIDPVAIPTMVGKTFKSWVPALPKTMPAEDVEVYATWSDKTVTVYFDTDITDYKIPSKTVTYGSEISLPTLDEVNNQILIAWKTPADDLITMPGGVLKVENDITLKAVWDVKLTTITLDPNGGYWGNDKTNTKPHPITQKVGSKVNLPADPTRPGYKFDGWDGVIPTSQPAANVKFTAAWTPLDVKTIWNSYGETVSTKTTKAGSELTPPSAPVPEAGWKFVGWKSSLDQKVYKVSNGPDGDFPIPTPSVETTFTAVFEAITYKYTFLAENGTTISSGEQLCGSDINVPPAPAKTGHTFIGWVDATDTTKIEAGETTVEMQAGDATYTAKYKANVHKITWNANGGTIDGKSTKVVEVAYGETFEVPVAVNTGYTCEWTPSVPIPTIMPDNDLSFTATWEAAGDTPYFIETYKMGTDGKYVKDGVTVEKSGTTGGDANAEVKAIDGFTFNASESVISGKIAANGSTVLKVYYDRNKYDLYAKDDATATAVKVGSYYYEETITYPTAPTKEGNTFAGWAAKPAGDKMPAGIVTIVGTWTVNSYTITFMVEGVEYHKLTIAYGADVVAPSNPVVADKFFEGWSPALPEKMIAQNLVLTAVFGAASTHKVTFHTNNGGKFVVLNDKGEVVNTSTTASFDVKRGDKMPCPTDLVMDSGKRFIGWAYHKGDEVYTEKDVLFSSAEDNYIMRDTRDIYLYAVYVTPSCEVKFMVDGEEVTELAKTVKYDNVVDPSTVKVESPLGHTFSGWKLYSVNGTLIERDKDGNVTNLPKDVNIKVDKVDKEWTVGDNEYTVVYAGTQDPNKHNVNFHSGANGHWNKTAANGDVTEETLKVVETKYGATIAVPEDPIADKGMLFLGWTTDAEKAANDPLNAVIANIDKLTDVEKDEDGNVSYVVGGDYNYFAVYVIEEYEIRFIEWNEPKTDKYPNDTREATYKKVVYYGNSVDISAYIPGGKTGYTQDEDNGYYPAAPATITRETILELSKYEGVVSEGERKYDDHGVEKTYPITVITLKVVYKPSDYKITFSGCSYLTTKVPCDAAINDYVNAIPTAEGKTFVKWTDENGEQFGSWSEDGKTYNLGTMPAENIELHAVWTLNTYTISYYITVGGTKIDSKIYEYGAEIDVPADPIRTGYTFAGWDPAIPATMPAKDLTIVAKWNAHDVTISFDTNGGQPASIPSVTKKYAENFTTPAAPTKTGHTFDGWKSSNGNVYAAGETFQVPANGITLTAKWTVNNYSVNIDTNGGTAVEGNYINMPYGTAINENIERTGHELAGWKGWVTDTQTEADAVLYASLPSSIPAANMSYKAVWDCVDHKLYFHPKQIPADNPETEADERLTDDKFMITLEFDCNAKIVPPTAVQFADKGYTVEPGKVIGTWKDASGTDVTFGKMNSDMIGNHYAVMTWADELYKVTFNTDGGSDVESQEVILNGEIKKPDDPTKEGHTFKYWVDEKGYEVEFDENEKLKLTEPKNVTFKAVWEVNEYTVTWDIDGKKETETYAYGAAIVKHADPVKEGYTFTGWAGYTDGMTMPAENVTFTAAWTVNYYNATFDPNGGVLKVTVKDKEGKVVQTFTTDEPYTMEIAFNTPMSTVAPTLEERQGYTSAGWVDALDKQPMPATMPAKDVTFNALWNGADGVVYTVNYFEMSTEGAYEKDGATNADKPYKTETLNGKTGTTATVTPDVREGFTVDTGKSKLSGEILADGSLVLNVYYSRNQYNLVTVVDGVRTATAYYYGAIIATPKVPADTEKLDYPDAWTWSWVDGETAKNYQPATMPATEVTASVTSGPMYYTITLYSAGDVENPRVAYGTVFDVETLEKPKLDGYTFSHWTDADENGNKVTTFTVTGDKKLYANYTAVVYEAVFYNSNPETNVKTSEVLGTKNIPYGEVVSYTAPTADGYTFTGWLAEGKLFDGENTKMLAKDMEFVAQWTKNQ